MILGYCRVSTDEQARSGLGLDAQRETIRAEAAHRGWTLLDVLADEGSGKTLKRPGLDRTLQLLANGEATALVVAKLDRVSRSVPDFGALLERAKREGWSFVALDLGVDTSTATGELVANVMMSVAQWERRVIGERTAAALAAKKRQGARLGRPVETAPEVRERITRERLSGKTLRAIGEGLTADGIATARGGTWHPASVGQVVRSVQLDVASRAACETSVSTTGVPA